MIVLVMSSMRLVRSIPWGEVTLPWLIHVTTLCWAAVAAVLVLEVPLVEGAAITAALAAGGG